MPYLRLFLIYLCMIVYCRNIDYIDCLRKKHRLLSLSMTQSTDCLLYRPPIVRFWSDFFWAVHSGWCFFVYRDGDFLSLRRISYAPHDLFVRFCSRGSYAHLHKPLFSQPAHDLFAHFYSHGSCACFHKPLFSKPAHDLYVQILPKRSCNSLSFRHISCISHDLYAPNSPKRSYNPLSFLRISYVPHDLYAQKPSKKSCNSLSFLQISYELMNRLY